MKTTTKKTTTPKTSPKAGEPMDPSIREGGQGTQHVNNRRNAYALVQLVSEVRDLFPEVPYEFDNYDGRNTALDVVFDLTAIPAEDQGDLATLLATVETDSRVRTVISQEGMVLVGLHSNPRTQDGRAEFGLAAALDVLAEPYEGDSL